MPSFFTKIKFSFLVWFVQISVPKYFQFYFIDDFRLKHLIVWPTPNRLQICSRIKIARQSCTFCIPFYSLLYSHLIRHIVYFSTLVTSVVFMFSICVFLHVICSNVHFMLLLSIYFFFFKYVEMSRSFSLPCNFFWLSLWDNVFLIFGLEISLNHFCTVLFVLCSFSGLLVFYLSPWFFLWSVVYVLRGLLLNFFFYFISITL